MKDTKQLEENFKFLRDAVKGFNARFTNFNV
jgi:hypothetical protein